MLIETKN